MGLFLWIRRRPSLRGLDHADDSLTAGMHVDVLHRDLLLPLAAVTIERVKQHGIRSRQLVAMSSRKSHARGAS